MKIFCQFLKYCDQVRSMFWMCQTIAPLIPDGGHIYILHIYHQHIRSSYSIVWNVRSYHQHVFCGFINQGCSRKVKPLIMVVAEMVKKIMMIFMMTTQQIPNHIHQNIFSKLCLISDQVCLWDDKSSSDWSHQEPCSWSCRKEGQDVVIIIITIVIIVIIIIIIFIIFIIIVNNAGTKSSW